jgi:hypothetical protein
VSGAIDRREISVTVEQAPGTFTGRAALSVGLGWALLMSHTVVLTPALVAVNGAWLALLTIPSAFYAARRGFLLTRDRQPRRLVSWLWLPLAVLVVGLGVIPALAGCAASSAVEWSGGMCGAAIGIALARGAGPGPRLRSE